MIIASKPLARRTVLRGIGATLALPFLECMVPTALARAKSPASFPRRLAAVYVPNGIVMENWTPASEGSGFALSPILQPLAPFQDRLVVVTGLNNYDHHQSHETGSTKFLTCVRAKETQGADLLAGVSVDQVAAQASAARRDWDRWRLLLTLENSVARVAQAIAAPIPTRSPGGLKPRPCQWRPIRVWSSNACWAIWARTRSRDSPGSGKIAASWTW